MTRKHLVLIADAFRRSQPGIRNALEEAKLEQWRKTVEEFLRIGRLLNPNFSEEKFMVACGYSR